MMEEKYQRIFNFVSVREYPSGYTKKHRQNLRQTSAPFTLKDGELFYQNRRCIKTEEEAGRIFGQFHASPIGGHSGINKTQSAISSRFFWHGMSMDIAKWVQECEQCQKFEKPICAPQPLQCIKVSAVWELVGIDLTGPLPKTVDGFQYILTATDYFSKWVGAYPLKTKSAAEVGRHICSMIYRHGCPKRILSDQGREFVNQLNDQLCSILQIERSVTAAYHPRTNGLDEKTNHNIKRALTKLVNEQQTNWDVYLDATLFSLRSKLQTTTGFSPFLLMYGREAVFPAEVPVELPLSNIILPGEKSYCSFVDHKKTSMEKTKETTTVKIEKSQERQQIKHSKKVMKKNKDVVYSVGNEVLLYNMRKSGRKGGRVEPDFSGPYFIKELCGKVVKLENSHGVTLKNKVNVDHIKPYGRSQRSAVHKQEDDVHIPEENIACVSSVPQRASVICSAGTEKFENYGKLRMTSPSKQLWDHSSFMFLRFIHCMEIIGWLMR